MLLRELPYSDEVLRARNDFLSEIRTMPEPLGTTMSEYVTSRIQRGPSGVLLGEYAPWLIADVFGYYEVERFRSFVGCWLHLYFYTLTIDDQIDQQLYSQRPLLAIASGLVLQKGLRKLRSLESNCRSEVLVDGISEDFEQLALAACKEIRHREASAIYESDIPEIDSDKARLLNICLRFLSDESTSDRRTAADWEVVKHLLHAIQLLDDINDFEEDWLRGHWTKPIALTIHRMRHDGQDSPLPIEKVSGARLLWAMIETKALQDCIEEANCQISEFLLRSTSESDSQWSQYAMKLKSSLQEFAMCVEVAREHLGCFQDNSQASCLSQQSRRQVSQILDKVRKQFVLIAQDS